jgi:hypothetical protein
MGLLDGLGGKAIEGYISSPEGRDQIIKFITSPEGMAVLQQFITSPQGKQVASQMVMPMLENLGVPEPVRQTVGQYLK